MRFIFMILILTIKLLIIAPFSLSTDDVSIPSNKVDSAYRPHSWRHRHTTAGIRQPLQTVYKPVCGNNNIFLFAANQVIYDTILKKWNNKRNRSPRWTGSSG